MSDLSTAQVSEHLSTTPKILRRFLRADATYANAGAGGRYAFTSSDLPTLARRFKAWNAKSSTRPAAVRVASEDDDAMSVEILQRRLTSRDREAIRLLSIQRVDRLEEQLKARGLHISQLRQREYAS
jgi:hypothetical protein